MTKASLFKTWIEVNKRAVQHNFQAIKALLQPKTRLWAVVKSNAYGHGLTTFALLMKEFGADGFCVDSAIEGAKLRESGIKKPILVLGPTFLNFFDLAAKNQLTITISNQESLEELSRSKNKPDFHLKIDTGMHRQGFYVEQLPKAIRLIINNKLPITGIYTHFASAKDLNYPTFTDSQFEKFQKASAALEKAGLKGLIKHCAATGATLINPKYHLDAVRIGIGLYGLWPSKELEIQSGKFKPKPVLTWRALVSEVKNIKKGEYVGYDLTEKVSRDGKIAVIPIGYWHGLPRALSGIGEVLIQEKKARILGRVSMDMIVVDVTGIKCSRGDVATVIGKELTVSDMAQKMGASHYEVITRINPLIERVVK